MNVAEVAKAYVTIIPSLQGAQQTITQELTGAGNAAGTTAGKKTGTAMMSSMGKSMTSAGKTMTAAVTVPVMAMGKAAFGAASDFEASFAQLQTIADTSAVSIDELKGGVVDLSGELGISASEISAAAYSAISAGQATEDALGFVASAAKLARGGFTSVSTATDVLTTALNAYGLEADQVSHVSDVLIETQNEGKTTVDELAASMGRVIPTAANVNVGLEDLASQYVALTKNGIGTAEATTYINSMLNELGKNGSTAFDMFKDAAGMTFPEYIAAGHSTTEAMDLLATACSEAGLTVSDAFGSAEAGKAANTLVQHADDSTTALENMATMAGQTEAAYETMSDTTAVKVEEMKTSLENSAISLGETIIPLVVPIMEKIVSGVESIATWFASLDEDSQELIITIAGIVAVAGPLLIVGGKIAGGISSIMGLVGGLGGALSGVVGHIGNFASGLGIFGSKAASAATGATSAATSFGTLAGQALLLIAAGAAVYLIAQAMSVLVNSAIELANAGPLAIAVFVGIAAVAVGVTAAIVAIGSAATVSAVGLLAMGAAVLMVSAGISLIIISLTSFVQQLPLISTYGASAAAALLGISAAMVALAASAVAVTAAMAAMSVALLASTVTFVTVAASTVAVEAAFALLLAELLLVDGEALLLNAALMMISGTMSSISTSASTTAASLQEMVTSVSVVEQGLNALGSLASAVVDGLVSLFSSGMTSVDNTVATRTASMTTAWSNAMNKLLATTRTTMATMVSTISSAVNTAASKFSGTTLRFNQHVAIPHFSMYGSFDAASGSVPQVGVSWYKRAATEGALFKTPQIIGVGDAAQPELLIGEEKLKELLGGGKNITVNVYGAVGQDEGVLASIVARKLQEMVDGRRAVYA